MRYTLTLLLALSTLVGKSQLITLTSADQTVTYNGATVDIWAPTENGQMSFVLDCVLNADAPKQVNVRRYELSYPSGHTENSYCWGECYNSDTTGDHPVWNAPTTVLMYPGQAFTGFDAYYDPKGIMGTAAFRFVWFDDSAPDASDSSWTDVVFHASAVGISDIASASDARFTVFPVPSATGRVEFTFDALRAGQEGRVEFYDLLGGLLFNEPLSQGQQHFILPAGKLNAGTWFASLRVDGRIVATRRVVVVGD